MHCEACGASAGPFKTTGTTVVCADARACNARYLKQNPCNSPEDYEALTGAYSIFDTYDPWD